MVTIKEKFARLKKENKKAFITYIPFGFPSLEAYPDLLFTLGKSSDIIEIGLPFSDPLADGAIIQEASKIALAAGTTTLKMFRILKRAKEKIPVPLILMTYFNPVNKFGMKKFMEQAHKSGISGIMIVDLPIEESREYIREAREKKLETIFFITPTTEAKRAVSIVKNSRGFIYYVSSVGITGPRDVIFKPVANHINSIRKLTNLPVCVGFGIHKHEQVVSAAKIADGVIVGSALIKEIKKHYGGKKFGFSITRFLEKLRV